MHAYLCTGVKPHICMPKNTHTQYANTHIVTYWHTYVFMHARLSDIHTYVHRYAHSCTHARALTHTHAHTYAHTHVHTHTNTLKNTITHTCSQHARMHTHAHAHTHTLTYTHTNIVITHNICKLVIIYVYKLYNKIIGNEKKPLC